MHPTSARRRLLPAALCAFAALAALPLGACGILGGAQDAPDDAQTAAELQEPQSIPHEALPNPLPEPYIFRDDPARQQIPEVSEVTYVVRAGDTLDSIARRYCTSVARVQRVNGIVDPSQLRIGDILRVPISSDDCDVQILTGADGETERAQLDQDSIGYYFVQEGDTLFDIALKFGLEWDVLQDVNGLTNDQAAVLTVGQRLIIPAVNPDPPQPSADAGTADPQTGDQAGAPEDDAQEDDAEPPG